MALDIKGLAGSLVDLGFELAGQILVTAVYTHRTATTYDPTTGAKTETKEEATVKAILQPYTEREIDGDRIRIGDRRAIIKRSELRGISEFSQQDTLTIGTEDWQFIDPGYDPADAVLKGQIRKIA